MTKLCLFSSSFRYYVSPSGKKLRSTVEVQKLVFIFFSFSFPHNILVLLLGLGRETLKCFLVTYRLFLDTVRSLNCWFCRYLNENPQYIRDEVKLSQFSFQIPKPLQDNYVRKRPARVMESSDNTRTPVATAGMLLPFPTLTSSVYE